MSLLRRASLRSLVDRTRTLQSRANIKAIHLAASSYHRNEATNTSLMRTDSICFSCFSSSSDASTNYKLREGPKRNTTEERMRLRRRINLFLDQKENPPGSFTPEMWEECKRVLEDFATEKDITPKDVRLSLSLLERLVKEHSVAGVHKEEHWLFETQFLNRLVKQWRNVARKRGKEVIDPVNLGKMLEGLSKQVPEFKYDKATFSMIMDVILRQKSPQEAPIIAESLLNFLKEEADKGRPELQPNHVIWNQVLKAWSNSGRPEAPDRMEALLERMKEERIEVAQFAWSCLMDYWVKSQRPERSEKMEDVLERMKAQGVEPDVVNWTQVLSAHARAGGRYHIRKAEAILARMAEADVTPNVFTYNTLIHAWSKSKLPEAAEKAEAVFRRMKASAVEPTAVSYLSLISTHASFGNADRAEQILKEMTDGYKAGNTQLRPNIRTLNTVLNACCSSTDPTALQKAEEMFQNMIDGKFRGVQPDTATFNIIVRACLRRGDPSRTEKYLQQMDEFGLQADTITFNEILKAWIKVRSPSAAEKAESILWQMLELFKSSNPSAKPNVYSIDMVIQGWATSGHAKAVERMMEIFSLAEDGTFGILPNLFAYVRVVLCLLQTEDREMIQEADNIVRRIPTNTTCDNIDDFFKLQRLVILMWIRAGCFDEAESLQRHMYKRHVDEGARPNSKWYLFIMKEWIEANELERADAVYRKMLELEAAGHFAHGIDYSTRMQLVRGWKESDHPDKQRYIAVLEERKDPKKNDGSAGPLTS